jgi:hypothetical protein
MNLDKIIAELRTEVEIIEEAIAALQKLVPSHSSRHSDEGGRSKPRKTASED